MKNTSGFKPMKFLHRDQSGETEPSGFKVEKQGAGAEAPVAEERELNEAGKELESSPREKPKATELDTPSRQMSSNVALSKSAVKLQEPKNEALLCIEMILEEGLETTYASLDEAARLRFKTEGEATAKRIEQLLTQAKVKVKEILDLIRHWLLIIPGVNKFFIEQETKIKTDKIMTLRRR